ALYRSYRHSKWLWVDKSTLVLCLALVTYTYATGKFLGPMLAFGLVIFARTWRQAKEVMETWILFGISLIPLWGFNQRHPGVLGARFQQLTYITPGKTIHQTFIEFAHRYWTNFDLVHWVYVGDGNARHHVPGAMGSLLGGTVLFAVIGLVLVVIKQWKSPWW